MKINACIDNFRKLPVTLLLCALGFNFERVCEVVSYPGSLAFYRKTFKTKIM